MKRFFVVVGIILILLGCFVAFFAPAAWLRIPPPDAKRIRVNIPEGSNVSKVADILAEKNMVRSAFWYLVFVRFYSSATRPKAGEYDLLEGSSYKLIARTFAIGPARNEVSVTVIEGWTIQEIQDALVAMQIDVVPSDFLAERFAEEFSFLKSLPKGTTVEGYFFPETYRVWKDQLPDSLFRKQLLEFMTATGGFEEEAKKQGRTLHEVVILASIIEKEVRRDEDRPIVAGIFMNRIRKGMRLQSDATLNYVTRSGRSRLTAEDLKNESPYNTYVHAGLPPGPIANPGKASLEAALHPAETSYFYFLTDAAGKIYYARTLEEHVANRYKAYGQ
jgi:UPF0755 protein